MSNDSGAIIQLLIDDNIINIDISRFSRTDVDNTVSNNYGGSASTPNAGFCMKLDLSTLTKGNHTIKVRELSRYGDIICETCKNIIIINKKYLRRYLD